MKILFLVAFIFSSTIAISQSVFEKYNNEKADSFMIRAFPQIDFFQVVTGNWGDSTSKFKIIGFYFDTTEFNNKAIILQAISSNKFQRLKFNYTFGIGDTHNITEIVSIFFYDTDQNGIRELIVLESATGRCHDELEEYNETTKKIEKIPIIVACDLCAYSIFEQKINSLIVNNIDVNDGLTGDCNAKNVKEFLKHKK